jgi:hypothetical protein
VGEAKRRQKLDPNFGQNYPSTEDNWVFTSADDQVAVGNLPQCLFMAGVTTTDDYHLKYLKPLSEGNLTLKEKSTLVSSLFLSQPTINNHQHQLLFHEAVKNGSVFVVFDEDDPDIFSHHICYNPRRAHFFREHGY